MERKKDRKTERDRKTNGVKKKKSPPIPDGKQHKNAIPAYLFDRLFEPILVSWLGESISDDTCALMLPQRHHDAAVRDHLICGVQHTLRNATISHHHHASNCQQLVVS